jgi:hypothetical protein
MAGGNPIVWLLDLISHCHSSDSELHGNGKARLLGVEPYEPGEAVRLDFIKDCLAQLRATSRHAHGMMAQIRHVSEA